MIFDLQYKQNGQAHIKMGATKEQIDVILSTIKNEHVRKSVRIDAFDDTGTEFFETLDADWKPVEVFSWVDLYPNMPIK